MRTTRLKTLIPAALLAVVGGLLAPASSAQADPNTGQIAAPQGPMYTNGTPSLRARAAAAPGAPSISITRNGFTAESVEKHSPLIRLPQKEVVGNVYYKLKQSMTLDTKSLDFWETLTVEVTRTDGLGTGATLSVTPSCGGTCTARSSLPKSMSMTPGAVLTGRIDYTDAVSRGAHDDSAKYVLEVSRPGFTAASTRWESPAFRCDDQVKGMRAGCVIPEAAPTLTTMKQLPGIAQNIRNIQNAPGGLGIGKPGSGHPLTRTTSTVVERANRNTACPARVKKAAPSGMSCDEYPFAKTMEGAANAQKPNWGFAYVPVSEQNSQGGYLRAFFMQERILDGDSFYVEV